jgi:uncharacterized protein
MTTQKNLIVSVHDVSPRTSAETMQIMKALDSKGVGPVSLLVIPDYKGTFPLDGSDQVPAREQLRILKKRGHEVVQHGQTHDAGIEGYDSFIERILVSTLTRGSAEYRTMNKDHAKVSIEAGRKILTDAGLVLKRAENNGFALPGGFGNEAVYGALEELGFSYSADRLKIKDLKTGEVIKSPALGFSAKEGLCTYMEKLNHFLARGALRNSDLVRVTIHPADVYEGREGRPLDAALKLVDRLAQDRDLATYRQFIEERRNTSA